ncbi:MAG: hypothetical protein LUC18_03565 [Porphyromonadaceae bacterium]|nr:hypothetical protein [Porphyromonadaceae bacterium]
MIDIGVLIVGLSSAGLHALLCCRLFGPTATLVILRGQAAVAIGITCIRIRAPD